MWNRYGIPTAYRVLNNKDRQPKTIINLSQSIAPRIKTVYTLHMTTAVHLSPLRHYRQQYTRHDGEQAFQVVVEETDLHVTACCDLTQEVGAYVAELRGQLKAFISLHPEFQESLTPVAVPERSSEIIKRMANATAIAGVGPMAAVAGTISQMVCERFADYSSELVVENGGDVFMMSTKNRVAGLLPDPHSSATVGVVVHAKEFPVAICSSSATIGHSLSLGKGELVAVRSIDGSLADACATALCNTIKNARDVEKVTEQAEAFAQYGIEGVFAQCDGRIGLWGKMELAVV